MLRMLVETYQPAAFERVVDSIRGVLTQGFLFCEGVMGAIIDELDLLCAGDHSVCQRDI
jgi:hypothetical protein